MAKQKTVYFCSQCGHESSKWMGQCPACKQWNTFTEEKVTETKKGGAKSLKTSASPMNISEVTVENEERIPTGIHELDCVLGGGIDQRFPIVGRRRSGNREIHVIITGMQESCEQQT